MIVMEYEEYTDVNKIKQAKKILNNILIKLRNYAKEQKISELVGSGKNGIILIPQNAENQGKILFDLDFQIMITGWKTEDEDDWRKKFRIIKNKLTNLFKEKGFTLSNTHERCYKFYPDDSNGTTYRFRFENVFTVYDKKTKKKYEIKENKDGILVREEKGETVKPIIYQKLKKIKKNNLWKQLVERYINKREKDDEKPHYQSFVMSVNEIVPSLV